MFVQIKIKKLKVAKEIYYDNRNSSKPYKDKIKRVI